MQKKVPTLNKLSDHPLSNIILLNERKIIPYRENPRWCPVSKYSKSSQTFNY